MLELKQVSAGYGGRTVLPVVSLSFEPGMLYTIIGKNGCGKSTLLKCCAGLLAPKAGEVLLDGRELSAYPSEERARRLSYLSQSRPAPNITVERMMVHSRFPHLAYPKKLRREDMEIIHEALAAMQAEEFAARSLRSLSGGERQRVYLAMQLAQDAPVMLLDEPTTFLDIEYQLRLMETLAGLKARGKTIVVILHDLEQALRWSDCVVAIREDKRLFSGTPEEILNGGILRDVFHVNVRRSEYRFELNNG